MEIEKANGNTDKIINENTENNKCCIS